MVAYNGNSITFNQTDLSVGKKYYYTIFSFNGEGTAINYLLEAPCQANQINDAEGPDISNVNINPDPVDIGVGVEISAQIEDISSVKSVVLRYKKGGESQFQNNLNMTVDGNIYRGTIPGTAVTADAVIFRISAYDVLNNETIYDGSLQIIIPSGTLSTAMTVGNPYQSGFPEKQWRMISIPLDLDNKGVNDVLSALGTPGNTTWKLYEGSENDVSTSAQFIPGKAFWLQQALGRGSIQITLGKGKIINADAAVITLLPGWNQIGNPFNFVVGWEDGTNALSNANIKGPIKWDGSKYTGIGQTVEDSTGIVEIIPWDGYFVYNTANTNQNLIINPSATESSPKIAFRKDNDNQLKQDTWQINFSVSSKDKQDIYNYIGMAGNASDLEDSYDLPELPVIGEYISLYFDHLANDNRIYPYTIDYRSLTEEGSIWTMRIRSNIKNFKSVLNWHYYNVPQKYQMAILDVTNNTILTVDNNLYEFYNRYENHPYQLKVIVGIDTWVREKLLAERRKLPGEYSLIQNYPNPFNSSTKICFGLQKQSQVSLAIFNILGEKIKTLLSNQILDTGIHETWWNSKNDQGESVSSGIYIYRIRIDEFQSSRKMVLIK